MKKVFCDRCKKEIKDAEIWKIDAQYVLQLKDKNGVFSKRDLCLSCLNDLKRWSISPGEPVSAVVKDPPPPPTAAISLETWYSSKDYVIFFENDDDGLSENFCIRRRK